jgi:hypothetical protein
VSPSRFTDPDAPLIVSEAGRFCIGTLIDSKSSYESRARLENYQSVIQVITPSLLSVCRIDTRRSEMNHRVFQVARQVLFAAFVVLWFGVLPVLAQDKSPVPSDVEQAKALRLLRDIFKAEYDDAQTAEQKSQLAKKMLEQASQSKADSLSYYMLLRVARDIAVTAGDAGTAIQAIDRMAETYKIDAVQLKSQILPMLSRAKGVDEAEWITMFDGKSLSGWKADQNPQMWSATNGAIVGKGNLSQISHLYFERAFVDFEVETEIKVDQDVNSGFYLRAAKGGQIPEGYEVQIFGKHGTSSSTGSVWGIAPVKEDLIQFGQWFRLRITAKGNQITVEIDGKKVVDHTDTNNKYRAGYFALQYLKSAGEVQFRNMRVRALD